MFIGAYAINPINDKKVPIYAADYVLYSYGTGAVMGVPAHDERDFAFAAKYGLPVTRVIHSTKGDDELPYCEDGVMINSINFDGLKSDEGRQAVLKRLSEMGKGGAKVNYRLRDWLVSRQRYWGAPIPMVYCKKCGMVPVPEKDLPVLLPYDVEFKPDGKSPLAKHQGFMHTKCPCCGGEATRDPDTLDTFVCSSWYYLRYPDSNDSSKAFDPEIINKMLPVDKYVGGAEHACMHLLYARFVTKALRDMGYLNFDEPFKSLTHQGTILGPDGYKMSKSRGNVISPDDYIETYGADVFRLYLMFGFSYVEGGPWNDEGIKSIAKFLDRVERICLKINDYKVNKKVCDIGKDEKELLYALNYTIKCVDRDMDSFSFNTAVARLMELVNALYKYDGVPEERKNVALMKEAEEKLIGLLAPMCPHFCEELWSLMGNKKSVFLSEYPVCDEKYLTLDEIEYGVQINSKMKTKLVLSAEATKQEIEAAALADEKVKEAVGNKKVEKIIVIPKRLVNIIVK